MADLRYALRLLRKSPLFTATVILIIALGIGGTTTIFSVVYAVLIRPLPFDQPDRLLQVAEKNDALHLPVFGASALNYLDWQQRTRTFDRLAAVQFTTFTLSGTGDPETYTGFLITPSLMPMLGIRPLAGRGFAEEDGKVGAPPVALISDSLWRRRFGGDPGIVGRAIALDGTSTTIVGVAPPALSVLSTGDIWVPLAIDPAKQIRLNHVLFVA